jgi:hypothetical protein
MNRRFALTAVACLFSAVISSSAASQAKPASSTTPAAPPAAAKWVPPMKGLVSIEYTQGKPQIVGKEIQTKFKLRNTSRGAIALLSVEEIWYNTKREIASNGIYRHRQLLNPGEIIEFTISAEKKPDLYTNMLMFRHAYGTVEPKKVPKLQ